MTTESLRVEDLDATSKADLEKFAADNDIKVEGTGAGGNVLKSDLERAITSYLEEQHAATDDTPPVDDPDAAVAAEGADGEQPPADDAPADPADTSPPDADPADDPADEVDDEPDASGEYVEVRREITRTTIDGDWWDPFSDHSMHHSVDVCPVNGARREGDEAVLLVPAEEADRYADR